MSVGGVTTSYYTTRYNNTNTTKGTETTSFSDTITEKASTSKIDWDELAFEHARSNAPQPVKDAWMEAARETGANGLGLTSNGQWPTEMKTQQVVAWYNGGKEGRPYDVLGSSVESAILATKKALYNFDHPLQANSSMSIEERQYHMKERQFYVAFLEKLEKLQSGQSSENTAMNAKFTSEIGEYYLHGLNRRSATVISTEDTFSERTRITGAWNKTLEETGIDPFPMNRISTALVILFESGQRGLGSNFPGETVDSATSLVKKIIHRLENPLAPPQNPEFRKNELIFYRKFLENLKA